MPPLRKILFPTDFSTPARAAGEYACGLAEKFGAELHLLSVIHDAEMLSPDPTGTYILPTQTLEEISSSVEQTLAGLPIPCAIPPERVVRRVIRGTPFLEIIRYSREQSIDMIVLGTHGRTGLIHVLLGSTAERIVRKAPCPVLTVRPQDHPFELP